jgi:hypothetical protein
MVLLGACRRETSSAPFACGLFVLLLSSWLRFSPANGKEPGKVWVFAHDHPSVERGVVVVEEKPIGRATKSALPPGYLIESLD